MVKEEIIDRLVEEISQQESKRADLEEELDEVDEESRRKELKEEIEDIEKDIKYIKSELEQYRNDEIGELGE